MSVSLRACSALLMTYLNSLVCMTGLVGRANLADMVGLTSYLIPQIGL